jgi:eukaryotic-like serine/threonine-protein kinase
MPIEPRLKQLLENWEDLRDAGKVPTPEEHCRECPDLLEAFRRLLRRFERLDHLGDEDDNGAPSSVPAVAAAQSETVRFRVKSEPRRGGMGEVFAAQDVELGRRVALKFIQRGKGGAQAERRFRREVAITARLQHPGVVPVFGPAQSDDGRSGYAMRFIEGESMDEAIARHHSTIADEKMKPTRAELLERFVAVCNTVAYAHSRGVIHRDLKPANIMLGDYGETFVVDWGLGKVIGGSDAEETADAEIAAALAAEDSRETDVGAAIGTYAYMPPEQARGDIALVDERADVFALGVVLCKILTGQPAYTGSGLLQKARDAELAACFARLDASRADLGLIALAKRCLEKSMTDRPRNAQAVLEALQAHQAAVEARARQDRERRVAAEAKATEERRRRRVTVIFASFVLVTLVGGGIALGFWWKAQVEQRLAKEHRRSMLEGDFTGTEEAMRHEDWGKSKELLERAQGHMEGESSDTLHARHETLRDQLQFVGDLEKVREQALQFNPSAESQYAATGVRVVPVGSEYSELFRRRGLRIGEQDATEIARWIDRSPVREPIIEALHHWFGNDKANRENLLAVLDQVDAQDAARVQLRKKVLDGKWEGSPDVDVKDMTLHGLRCVVFLAQGNPDLIAPVRGSVEQRKPLGENALRDAAFSIHRLQEAYPHDFWLNLFAASSALTARPHRLQDGIGYARAAVSLRPESPQANYLIGYLLFENDSDPENAIRYFKRTLELDPRHIESQTALGLALERKKDWSGAVEAHQRAIAINPRLAVPYNNLASTLRAKGDTKGALEAVQKALEIDPALARAHNNHGMLLMDSKDLEGALRHLRKAVELDPEDPIAHFNLGAVLKAKKNLVEAIAAYRKAVALDPRYARAHSNLGSALADKGDHEAAVRAYEMAIIVDPANALYWSNYGDALRAKQELAAAIRAFKQAIELDGKDPVFHNNLAVAFYFQGDLNASIAEYKKAIQGDEKFIDAWINLGVVLLQTRDYQAAEETLRKAVQIDPRSARASYNLGSALKAQGKLQGAIDAYRDAIAKDGTFVLAYNNLGNVLRKSNDRQGALQAFKQATAVDPSFAEAYANLGDLLGEMGQVDDAIAACQKAVALNAKSVEACNNLAANYFRKGNWPEAIKTYKRATALSPLNATIHANLGEAFRQKGDLDEAVRACRTAIQLDPQYLSGYLNLDAVLRDKRDFNGAIAVLDEAMKLAPQNPLVHDRRALDLRLKGDRTGAIDEYRKAIALDPKLENAQWGLGLLLWQEGDVEGAIPCYEKVLELNPKNGDVLFGLGKLYLRVGRFAEAEKRFLESEKVGSVVPGNKLPARELIEQTRHLAELDAKLTLVLAGKEKVAEGIDLMTLGVLCFENKQMYLSATHFFTEGFAASPQLASDYRKQYRSSAARSAVLAAQGKGKEADKLMESDPPRLRRQALMWLKADLASWSKQLASEKAADREEARRSFEAWQKTPDLAAVREAAALQKLPQAERAEWASFWEKVSDLLKSSTGNE